MHNWGDTDFDWESLDKAITFIERRFKKWRLPVSQAKEKYGTCRIYCRLYWTCMLDITHPGWHRYPNKIYCWWDIFVFSKIVQLFNTIVHPIYKWLYRDTYYKACKMYPHIVDEICCMADYVELLDFYICSQ